MVHEIRSTQQTQSNAAHEMVNILEPFHLVVLHPTNDQFKHCFLVLDVEVVGVEDFHELLQSEAEYLVALRRDFAEALQDEVVR